MQFTFLLQRRIIFLFLWAMYLVQRRSMRQRVDTVSQAMEWQQHGAYYAESFCHLSVGRRSVQSRKFRIVPIDGRKWWIAYVNIKRYGNWYLNKGRPTWWHLLYYVNLLLSMFQMLIHPSSGACDYLLRCCVGCNDRGLCVNLFI